MKGAEGWHVTIRLVYNWSTMSKQREIVARILSTLPHTESDSESEYEGAVAGSQFLLSESGISHLLCL